MECLHLSAVVDTSTLPHLTGCATGSRRGTVGHVCVCDMFHMGIQESAMKSESSEWGGRSIISASLAYGSIWHRVLSSSSSKGVHQREREGGRERNSHRFYPPL